MWFTRVSIANPVFATMVMAAIMILGVLSWQRLPVEQGPDVSIPLAVVRTNYPGASAAMVEQEVTKPVEEALSTIGGVKTIYSGSAQGSSWVRAEFELNVDIKTAIQDVRDKVAVARRQFNRDVLEPAVFRADNENDQPVFWISLQSNVRSLREVSDIAELLVVKRLQSVAGVGSVDLYGSVRRELAIELKPEMMAAHGVGVDQIVQAVRDENADAPAGLLISDKGERVVQVRGRLRSALDFERIIVARRGAGATTNAVTLGQLATVRDAQREEEWYSTVDGVRGVTMPIRKVRGANTVEMGEALRAQIAELRKVLPEDVTLLVLNDQSIFIRDSVNNVKRTIIEGALLTVLIVFLFLHSWRSTVITGVTLPISVLATFIAMYALGLTINGITLMALSICIGVLIDDAIVVRENIMRHLAQGKPPRVAALEATREIGLAVMATTFAIVAVFVPVAFMGGQIGRTFYHFGITVVVAVMVSLFVSFTLDPMLSSVWKDPASRLLQAGPVGRVFAAQVRLMDGLHRWYDVALRCALAHRVMVLLVAAGSLAAAAAIYAANLVKTEFQPQVDDNYTGLRIQTPVGSALGYTRTKADQVEAALREFPEIEHIIKYVGSTGAGFELMLKDRSLRERSQKELDDAIRKRMKDIAGLEINVGWNRPINIFVQGPDISELDRIARELIPKIQAIRGAVEVESTFKPTSPALDIVVNRELASDLGVSISSIGATTRALIGGEPAGRWEGPDGESHQILVRLPRDERTGIADLSKIYVASYAYNADATPRMVPLRQIAEFKPTLAERTISRRNMMRQIQVRAALSKDATLGDVNAQIDRIVKAASLPPGYSFYQGGEQEDLRETTRYGVAALGIGIVFIYLVLASQFGSLLQPLAIMASLPLSLIGVFLALRIFGTTLNMYSAVGFIMLMGLVTKNAILLVDFTNRAMRDGKDRTAAILEAGQVRLRPILMTTAAMIFGMLPLALTLGAGSEQQSPMAHAVIGGIITSTIFTLVVVPVLYTYCESAGRKVSSRLASADEPETVRQNGD